MRVCVCARVRVCPCACVPVHTCVWFVSSQTQILIIHRPSPHLPFILRSDSDSGGTRHLFSFQPSDLSDAVTDIKWSPHDSNIFGSVTSDGRILIWDVRRIDPTVAHPIQPELTPQEQETLGKAEADLEKRRARKLEREKQANDPLLALAMSMKQQKGEMTEEDLKPVDTDEQLAKAEDDLEQMRNKYKKLTCIEFAPDAPVVVVGAADGTVCCLRIHGMEVPPYSSDEQKDRLDAALFQDSALMGAQED